jgi:multidrug efflux system membrane fusion protein
MKQMTRILQEKFMPLNPNQEPNTKAESTRSWRRLGAIVLGVAVLVAVAGVVIRQRSASEVKQWTQEQTIPTVAIISPHLGGASSTLTLPGNLQPFTEAPILARVNGYLKRWTHDIGAHVKKGELLAEIDTPELDHQLDQARADLASAVSNQQLAEVTARRWKNLLASDSVSQQAADEKAADLAARKAAADAARANVGRIEAFEDFKRVLAPFDGVITARKTDVGALISGGSGAELFSLASVDTLRLYVPVPQSYSQKIKVGLKAILTVPEHPERKFSAVLTRTSGAISGSSGTLLAELAVNNKEGLLTPGSYAEVQFNLAENTTVQRVPASALILRKGGIQLAVVQTDNHVKLRTVTVGHDFGTEMEILSGIEPTDRLVDNPPDSLEDGDMVRVSAPVAAVTPATATSAGETNKP